jgi:anti-sigma regulatory factor (Ser/Thr protein kinase)
VNENAGTDTTVRVGRGPDGGARAEGRAGPRRGDSTRRRGDHGGHPSSRAAPRTAEFEIEVSLYEALANAVEHGCGHDPEKRVEVIVACDEHKGMVIVVRDPGPGFNPESVPSPVVGENIYADGGRGIFLINQLMDEVRFEKNGTEIWMIKGLGRGGSEKK